MKNIFGAHFGYGTTTGQGIGGDGIFNIKVASENTSMGI